MGTPVNGASLTSLYVGFKAAFQRGFVSAEDIELWRLMAMEVPSNAREEIYQWLGEMPAMRKWLGDRVIKQLSGNEYRIKNEPYELTIDVKEDDVEDQQIAGLTPRFEDMGDSVAHLPLELVFEVINNGKTTLGYDDVPMFSTSHPVGSGVDSNYETGAAEPWVLLDASNKRRMPVIYQPRRKPRFVRKDRPTDDNMFFNGKAIYGADRRDGAGPGFWQKIFLSELDLIATNFDDAMAQMMEILNDEGRSMGITPTHLVTTPANRAKGKAILEAERNAAGGSNTNFKAVELVITNKLSIV